MKLSRMRITAISAGLAGAAVAGAVGTTALSGPAAATLAPLPAYATCALQSVPTLESLATPVESFTVGAPYVLACRHADGTETTEVVVYGS